MVGEAGKEEERLGRRRRGWEGGGEAGKEEESLGRRRRAWEGGGEPGKEEERLGRRGRAWEGDYCLVCFTDVACTCSVRDSIKVPSTQVYLVINM